MTAAERRLRGLASARQTEARDVDETASTNSLLGTRWSRTAASVLAGTATVALTHGLLPGPLGALGAVALAAAVALGVHRWVAGLEPAAVVGRRSAIAADLPLCLDLIAACVAAGLPVSATLPVLAEAFRGPLAEELSTVSQLLTWGSSREQAWSRLVDPATGGPQVAAAVRAILAAERRGTRLATTLATVAAGQRETAAADAIAAAHRAGVYAVAPLGLCFLPAFVLLGVVPVVVSTFTRLF